MKGTIKTTNGYFTDYCFVENFGQAQEVASCSGSNCKVSEYYCTGDSYGGETKSCSNGCSNGACNAEVQKSISVVYPNGGEQIYTGGTVHIQWQAINYPSTAKVQIGLRDNRYDPNLGSGEATITNTVNSGSYDWAVPTQIESMFLGVENVYSIVIYIDGGGTGKFDASDNYFTIKSSEVSVPKLNVSLDATTPVASAVIPGQTNVVLAKIKLTSGSSAVDNLNSIQIASDSINALSFINIRVFDGATQLGTFAPLLTNNGSYHYAWINVSNIKIPAYSSKTLTLKADVSNQASGYIRLGIAGLNFSYPGASVSGLPVYGFIQYISGNSVNVVSPNGGESLIAGESYSIRWNAPKATRVVIDVIGENGKVIDTGNIPAVLSNTGSYLWNIPTNTIAGKYKVKVMICPPWFSEGTCANIDLNSCGSDLSDNYFTISSEMFSWNLEKGNNLISFPIKPSSIKIVDILKPIEGKYYEAKVWDETKNVWANYSATSSDFTTIIFNKSYVINMKEAATLTIQGKKWDKTFAEWLNSLSFVSGWNAIGYPFLEQKTIKDIKFSYPLQNIQIYSPSQSKFNTVYDKLALALNSQSTASSNYSSAVFEPGKGYMGSFYDCSLAAYANTCQQLQCASGYTPKCNADGSNSAYLKGECYCK